jgi:prepilin-type N-terminal cleavage/methylation domain-containing protein/prepilin-type processing-associated H-X9-DG protein
MKRTGHPTARTQGAGFTLTEVLVVIAILAILSSLLLSAVSRAKAKGWGVVCASHQSELMRAYLLYAEDHRDRVLQSSDWCGNGYVDWTESEHNLDDAMLVGQYSRIAPYIGNTPQLFKCPADRYLSPVQRARGFKARVRSVAMNASSGFRYSPSGAAVKWRPWAKLSDIVTQTPAALFVLLDEHPDSIDNAVFFTTPQVARNYAGPFRWRDIPATYHEGGVNFAFLDGHVSMKRWTGRLASREWTSIRYRDRHEDAFVCKELADANDIKWVTDRDLETE